MPTGNNGSRSSTTASLLDNHQPPVPSQPHTSIPSRRSNYHIAPYSVALPTTNFSRTTRVGCALLGGIAFSLAVFLLTKLSGNPVVDSSETTQSPASAADSSISKAGSDFSLAPKTAACLGIAFLAATFIACFSAFLPSRRSRLSEQSQTDRQVTVRVVGPTN